MTEQYLLVKVDGSVSVVEIHNSEFNERVYSLIDCSTYELVHLPGDFYLVVDELGKCYETPKPVNLKASMLYPGTPYGDPIVGDVIIGRLGLVNGESDMIGLSEYDIMCFNKFFDLVAEKAEKLK